MPKQTIYPHLAREDILENSLWCSSDGAGITVKVTHVDNYYPFNVYYEWDERGVTKKHNKSLFAFQCRYYLPEAAVQVDVPDEYYMPDIFAAAKSRQS